MNPEFRRNLWLELAPRRLALAAVLLALAFFAAAVSGKNTQRPADVAGFLYYVIVVLWGSRNAALSVVGEIRERTWDAQRLSALTASEMTWGKLFGSTIYNWYAGGICLAVILVDSVARAGPLAGFVDLVYFLEIGIIAQAAALLASLVAARRRQLHSRLEIFVYQLAGLVAALAVFLVWETADPAGSLILGKSPTLFIAWWDRSFDARGFLLVSLAAFTGWILVGCYRLMRLELKMTNGPFVWLAFLAFIGLYAAGFDGWLSRGAATAGWDAVSLRLGLAASTFATLTYAMVLLEPKDRVHFRWLSGQLVKGRIDRVAGRLDGFMSTYLVLVAVTAILLWWRGNAAPQNAGTLALIASGLGFITRDVALFVLLNAMPGRRRGDFAAVMVLFALYLLIPSILSGVGIERAAVLFYPTPVEPLWLAPAIAWGEAALVFVLAMGRIALPERARQAAA